MAGSYCGSAGSMLNTMWVLFRYMLGLTNATMMYSSILGLNGPLLVQIFPSFMSVILAVS